MRSNHKEYRIWNFTSCSVCSQHHTKGGRPDALNGSRICLRCSVSDRHLGLYGWPRTQRQKGQKLGKQVSGLKVWLVDILYWRSTDYIGVAWTWFVSSLTLGSMPGRHLVRTVYQSHWNSVTVWQTSSQLILELAVFPVDIMHWRSIGYTRIPDF